MAPCQAASTRRQSKKSASRTAGGETQENEKRADPQEVTLPEAEPGRQVVVQAVPAGRQVRKVAGRW